MDKRKKTKYFRALSKSSCFHKKGHEADCVVADSLYMMGFGIIQVLFSQLPNFHDLWWLSIVAAVMSLAYSFIAIGLSIAQIVSVSLVLFIPTYANIFALVTGDSIGILSLVYFLPALTILRM